MKKKLYRMIHNLKYRYKINVALVCVSLVPVMILGYFCYNETRGLLLDRERESMETSLRQISSHLENQIQVYVNLANYISFDNSIQEVLEMQNATYFELYEKYTKVIDPILLSPKYFHKGIQSITIYSDHAIVEHDTTIAPLSQLKDVYWYDDFMEDETLTWQLQYDENKQLILIRKFPKLEFNKALLCIHLDYKALFASLAETASPNSMMYILDDRGRTVFYTDNMEEVYRREIGSDLQPMNKAYTYVEERIKEIDWKINLVRPNKDIASAANQITWTVLIVVCMCVVIILLLGYMMSYFAVHRIELLTQNMNEVEKGNLEVYVESHSNDEIGILIHSFERMITQIKTLIKEVYESKLALKEFEMKALQAQINPHFLYNSLSIINWEAIKANVPEISRITLTLATFYRTTLNKGKNMITVENELKNMSAYLEIQLIMHDHNFDVVQEIDSNILNYYMPNLILQPIVENAIEHGLDLKEEGRGVLNIIGKEVNENIIFIIEDNGVGIEEDKIETLLTYQAKGYGIKNVNDRIKLLYGRGYALCIKSQQGVGTQIRITIPKEIKSKKERGNV